MPVVFINRDEPIEKALRRLKKMVSKEGIIQSIKDHRYYEKPSDRKRRKLAKLKRKKPES